MVILKINYEKKHESKILNDLFSRGNRRVCVCVVCGLGGRVQWRKGEASGIDICWSVMKTLYTPYFKFK